MRSFYYRRSLNRNRLFNNDSYQCVSKKPDLILEQYFLGKTFASGIFEDRFGNVRRQFTVDIDGTWDGKTLTLTEDFIFGDGETETRVWSIEKIAPASYVGLPTMLSAQLKV